MPKKLIEPKRFNYEIPFQSFPLSSKNCRFNYFSNINNPFIIIVIVLSSANYPITFILMFTDKNNFFNNYPFEPYGLVC